MFQMTQKPNIPKGVLGSRQTLRGIQLCVYSIHIAATAATLSEMVKLSYQTFIVSFFPDFQRPK